MASEARRLTRTRQIEIVAIVADRLVKNEEWVKSEGRILFVQKFDFENVGFQVVN